MKFLLVQKGRISDNIRATVKAVKGASVYAVLKGNGYGLGLVETAKIVRDNGVHRFALTDLEDAIALRRAGFVEEEILMLRSTTEPKFIEGLIEYNLVGTVGSIEAAVAMSGIATAKKTVIEAHVEIDTGMGRYGFDPDEQDKLLQVYKYMDGLALTGIYTHFCEAWAKKDKKTRMQLDKLNAVIDALHAAGIEPGLVHAANSSAALLYDWARLGAVRIGSAISGRVAAKRHGVKLAKVGTMVSEIIEVRRLPKGATVGYGSAYTAKSERRIAIIPVGYADGFCVEKARDSYRLRDAFKYALSDLWRGVRGRKLYVTVGGERARVLGHVGMVNTVVDVTRIGAKVGDRVLMDVNPILVPQSIERVYE